MDVSAARSDLEQVVHKSMVYDRDRDDCCDGWRFSPSMCAHDERIPGLNLPLSPSHSLRGKLDEPFPKFQPFGTIYTDDARIKLGNGIHRLCFNCRAIETKTWRRSRLNPGKMVRLAQSCRVLVSHICSFVTNADFLSEHMLFRGQRHFRADAVRDLPLCTRAQTSLLILIVITSVHQLWRSLALLSTPLIPQWAVKRSHNTRRG